MSIYDLNAYEVIREEDLSDLKSKGILLKHKKSQAKILLFANDDENKVFTIGFRTPAPDSTGVPHIMEHSVLCGSKNFPVKDPFVELVKGSLNTFLNAMTYPDKTLYPVASCNSKDFQNLMHVYMDAVFYPNIYEHDEIFRQEGWSYKLDTADGKLEYNGVVYNEMKGAFSSPEGVLDRVIQNSLFPDTSYANESGGDPDVIPELTYEQFLNFHRTYYHPSNSYIYLYGDMDMEEKLRWLDENYLSAFDAIEVDSEIKYQKPFEEIRELEMEYSISSEESEEDNTYLSYNKVIGTSLDEKLYLAFQILDYALLSAPGAPLKKALLDAGIGKDIMGSYDNGIYQPIFSIVSKNANRDQKEAFIRVIEETLQSIVKNGMDKKSLEAGINYHEFRFREADFGNYPKGLMYGLQIMDSWLYDADPMLHLQYQKTFDYLKKAAQEGYFEQLIKDYLLDNPHEAVVIVSPEIDLTAREDAELAERLAKYKDSLSSEQVKALVKETAELKAYQEEPSTKEDLEKIPMLGREDIKRQSEPFSYKVKEEEKTTVVHSPMFTSGIAYIKLLFDMNVIPKEDLPYASLLKSVLGYVDTENFTYRDLTSEIHLNSGGLDFYVSSWEDLNEKGAFKGAFTAGIKVLYEKVGFAFDIIKEILTASKLDDEKRLGEILDEMRSRSRMRLEGASHSAAVARACSYFSPVRAFDDMTGGIEYFHFLEKTADAYSKDEKFRKELVRKLKETAEKLFAADNLMVGYTADEEGYKALPEELKKFKAALSDKPSRRYAFEFVPELKNEGFKTSSKVNYVARCGSFDAEAYTGALEVLKVIMNYEYLWQNLRVIGGAYGCMSNFGRSGTGCLVSYRDPKLAATDKIYEGIPEYLKNFSIDERDMTKYVIGAMSSVDTPLSPAVKGSRNLTAYLSGITDEMVQKKREQILDVTQEDIRALADILESILKTGAFCVIGNEQQIEADKNMFKEVKELFH